MRFRLVACRLVGVGLVCLFWVTVLIGRRRKISCWCRLGVASTARLTCRLPLVIEILRVRYGLVVDGLLRVDLMLLKFVPCRTMFE